MNVLRMRHNRSVRKWRYTLIALVFVGSAASAGISDFAPLGAHYPAFRIEKNENPENVMIAYVKLNSKCEFEQDAGNGSRPIFDFYWLMEGVRFKPVHRLIKRGIRNRLEIVWQVSSKHSFRVRLNDLKELQHDLPKREFTVSAVRSGEGCSVFARIQLGASDREQTLTLSRIHFESGRVFLPPFRRIEAVTLIGSSVATGKAVQHRYVAAVKSRRL